MHISAHTTTTTIIITIIIVIIIMMKRILGPLRASEPKGLLWQKDRALGQRGVDPSVLPLGYLLVRVTVCTWGHLETSKNQFVWFCTLHGRMPRETGQALAPRP